MSRFQFVADNSATFEVKRLCELVEIERSSYYAWRTGAPARAARAAADARLAERIRAVHAEDNTVGAPRVTAELNDGAPAGERVNHKRVARIMRTTGIAGYVKRRRVRTTIPEQSVPELHGLHGLVGTRTSPMNAADAGYAPAAAVAFLSADAESQGNSTYAARGWSGAARCVSGPAAGGT